MEILTNPSFMPAMAVVTFGVLFLRRLERTRNELLREIERREEKTLRELELLQARQETQIQIIEIPVSRTGELLPVPNRPHYSKWY
jgi:hypothetical protein